MARQDLNGKVVVITGASSGFGKGAALRFTQAGASVSCQRAESSFWKSLSASANLQVDARWQFRPT